MIADDAIMIQRQFGAHGFAVEVNQFQEMLADEIFRWGQQLGINLPIVPIKNQINKIVRIRTLTAFLARGKIRFKGGSRGAQMLVQQLRDFPFGEFDDGPDALEMGIRTAAMLLNRPQEDDGIQEVAIAV